MDHVPPSPSHRSPPVSPLAKKRARLDHEHATAFGGDISGIRAAQPLSPLPSSTLWRLPTEELQLNTFPSSSPTPMPCSELALFAGPGDLMPEAAGLQASLEELDFASYNARQEVVAKQQHDKATGASYARHLKSYHNWWAQYQADENKKNPLRVPIPAEPITVAKVAMFLSYEITRPKRKRGSTEVQEGTTVGRSAIAQAISALEHYRSERAHLYRADRDAQISLRSDNRIRAFEDAAKHNEPKRISQSQALKAAGTSADTYADTQLLEISKSFLAIKGGPKKLYTAIRNRAMVLLSSAVAFRGDSVRHLLWSDLFSREVPIHDVQIGHMVLALVFYADNAKNNQHGRVDEFGALRHRKTAQCAVGSLALLLFAHFHVLRNSVPDFTPDLNDRMYGEYGHRDWYAIHVFPASSLTSPMSYENHRQQVNILHINHDITITKVTHAGRSFAAQTSRSHGASYDDTKALGGWSDSGSFRACYERQLPLEALVSATMFNGRKPGTYFVARDTLEPPKELVAAVFPWVEEEMTKLQQRQSQSPLAKDIALIHFLNVLIWFRCVLLQDLAMLYSEAPNSYIFQFAPLNTPVFRSFASTANM